MTQYYKFVLLLVWVFVARAEENEGLDNWKTLSRVVNECLGQDEVSICFKMKTVNFLDRLVKAPTTVPINEYLSIANDPNAPPVDPNKAESTQPDLEATLPRGFAEKSDKLNDMIMSKLFTLATTKKFEYQLPTDSDITNEGRGARKPKPKGSAMMMMMGVGAMMMKMGMGMVSMLAGKAFVISKVALILALIMLLKKSQGGGGGSHPQVVYAESGHGGGGGGGDTGGHGGYKRYIDAQNLAYGSQTQDFK